MCCACVRVLLYTCIYSSCVCIFSYMYRGVCMYTHVYTYIYIVIVIVIVIEIYIYIYWGRGDDHKSRNWHWWKTQDLNSVIKILLLKYKNLDNQILYSICDMFDCPLWLYVAHSTLSLIVGNLKIHTAWNTNAWFRHPQMWMSGN
jgi:hypothetical protein